MGDDGDRAADRVPIAQVEVTGEELLSILYENEVVRRGSETYLQFDGQAIKIRDHCDLLPEWTEEMDEKMLFLRRKGIKPAPKMTRPKRPSLVKLENRILTTLEKARERLAGVVGRNNFRLVFKGLVLFSRGFVCQETTTYEKKLHKISI